MQEARAAGATKEVARLSQQMPRLQAAAEALVVPNAFGALLQREGALNLNATTSHVRSCYSYQPWVLPAALTLVFDKNAPDYELASALSR
jgi:hypothetical protein